MQSDQVLEGALGSLSMLTFVSDHMDAHATLMIQKKE